MLQPTLASLQYRYVCGQSYALPYRVHGSRDDESLTPQQKQALEALRQAMQRVDDELSRAGSTAVLRDELDRRNVSPYYIKFRNGDILSISVSDGTYAQRCRLTGICKLVDVLYVGRGGEPDVMTSAQVLKIATDPNVVEFALPQLANESSHPSKCPAIVLQYLGVDAFHAVRARLPIDEPTPPFLGPLGDWGIGESFGRVAFAYRSLYDPSVHDMISFHLKYQPTTFKTQFPGEPFEESATLLIGSNVRTVTHTFAHPFA